MGHRRTRISWHGPEHQNQACPIPDQLKIQHQSTQCLIRDCTSLSTLFVLAILISRLLLLRGRAESVRPQTQVEKKEAAGWTGKYRRENGLLPPGLLHAINTPTGPRPRPACSGILYPARSSPLGGALWPDEWLTLVGV